MTLSPEIKKQLKEASLGKDHVLYCPTCMQENEVYSASGHLPNQMNLHCIECANFVARLIKNNKDEWELDTSVYNH